MKTWVIAISLVANTLLANVAFADEAQTTPLKKEAATEIPTAEKAFVSVINQFGKAKIIELLGEPAKADDVKLKGSGKIVASIWHYHNINTAEDGSYYPTTELDFVDDKVVQVVFLNNDGTDVNESGKTYELPEVKPEM
jgi:hypothetical protein